MFSPKNHTSTDAMGIIRHICMLYRSCHDPRTNTTRDWGDSCHLAIFPHRQAGHMKGGTHACLCVCFLNMMSRAGKHRSQHRWWHKIVLLLLLVVGRLGLVEYVGHIRLLAMISFNSFTPTNIFKHMR